MTKPPERKADRVAREAAALRANLLKRKAQARQWETAKTPEEQSKGSERPVSENERDA